MTEKIRYLIVTIIINIIKFDYFYIWATVQSAYSSLELIGVQYLKTISFHMKASLSINMSYDQQTKVTDIH